jgi:hypothetical protein
LFIQTNVYCIHAAMHCFCIVEFLCFQIHLEIV